MDLSFVKRYYRVPRTEIAYLRFIIEAYDGLVFMRTIDPRAALIEAAYPPSRRRDAEALLTALAAETAMEEVAAPNPCPPL